MLTFEEGGVLGISLSADSLRVFSWR